MLCASIISELVRPEPVQIYPTPVEMQAENLSGIRRTLVGAFQPMGPVKLRVGDSSPVPHDRDLYSDEIDSDQSAPKPSDRVISASMPDLVHILQIESVPVLRKVYEQSKGSPPPA
jgi:hypothetical protein